MLSATGDWNPTHLSDPTRLAAAVGHVGTAPMLSAAGSTAGSAPVIWTASGFQHKHLKFMDIFFSFAN